MDRRRFLALSAITPIAAAVGPSLPGFVATVRTSKAEHTFGFASDGSAFLLDGSFFQIRSGEMHPARIPVLYWRHRIQMAKAMGMNTISLYVMWNYIEQTPGVFDFTTDRRNVEKFIRLCQAEGMWVLLRPGPYVCGEWDLGGLPPYLLADADIKLRVNSSIDPRYMAAVTRYFNELIPRMKPLMIENGGPILMVQIENEFGSYGSDDAYVEQLRQLWIDNGVPGPFYTEDGLGQVEANHTEVSGGAIALSGGDASSIAQARTAFPTVPAMAGEVYPGWLTHWGDPTIQGGDYEISSQLTQFMQQRLSFNLYMIHGGTSFGLFAGANADNLSGGYQADITSYDYSAPITEQGIGTARYFQYRDIVADYVGEPLANVPPAIATIARPADPALTPRPYASIWDNLPPAVSSVHPQPMERYGQNSGLILYRNELPSYTGGTLDIEYVHDYATVFLDGAYQGGFSRQQIPDEMSSRLNVTNGNAPLGLTHPPDGAATTLDILVEGMGRTNYGQALVDRKGILESVSLQDAGAQSGTLTNWQTYLCPMDDGYVKNLKRKTTDPQRPGLFFQLELDLAKVGDTYLDLSGWTKGIVWVNGNNLGRYWELGPQHALYCPASWLRYGTNKILIFDLHQVDPAPIALVRSLQ